MTGFGVSAAHLGQPDVGLLTLTEMADAAARIAGAVDVPVLADADTGYGSPLNVGRTIAEFERAGVAGVQLEDQMSPKRCGHLADKQVVPASEMVAKIRAAADARRDDALVVVARTDARAVESLDAALERAAAYAEAGADVLFVEAPQSEAEVEKIAAAFPDTPLVFNWVEGGRTPLPGLDRLASLGFAMVIFPIGPLLAATAAMRAYLQDPPRPAVPLAGFEEFTGLMGLPELLEQQRRYAPPDD